TELIIPYGIERINSYAFYYLTALQKIVISDSIIHIGDMAFAANIALEEVIFQGDLQTIGTGVFFCNVSLTNVVLPSNLEIISNLAFAFTLNLNAITFPETLVEIGPAAFQFSGLESIVLPDSLVTLGLLSFGNNSNLETIYFGSSLTQIGSSALLDSYNLKSVELSSTNPHLVLVDDVIYSRDFSILYLYLSIKENVTYKIPDSVFTINDGAFSNAKMRYIEFNEHMTHIPPYAFFKAEHLERVVLPDNITSAGFKSFQQAYRLAYFEFSSDFLIVPEQMFRQCYSLKTVIYSDNVEIIEQMEIEDNKTQEELNIILNNVKTILSVKND
ncbi:MAG: leucine-rich repeat domain-containing protein, partial [Erysipelotrichia bacterium]|nr:leucine-rich repeat domain-containing protein [Erysipelotrichia bacterium]